MKKIDENILRIAIIDAKNIAQVMANLKRADSSAGRRIVKKYINMYNISTIHFETAKERYARNINSFHKLSISDIFIENSTYLSGHNLKKRLYDEGMKKPICEKCGQDENWYGEHISMILDHINGIHNDNRVENLRILCPNCNATLSTHCRGYNKIKKQEEKRKIKIVDKKIRQIKSSQLQRTVKRPSLKQLQNEINEFGYTGTGKKYGVSDNAIRNWIKFYEKY